MGIYQKEEGGALGVSFLSNLSYFINPFINFRMLVSDCGLKVQAKTQTNAQGQVHVYVV